MLESIALSLAMAFPAAPAPVLTFEPVAAPQQKQGDTPKKGTETPKPKRPKADGSKPKPPKRPKAGKRPKRGGGSTPPPARPKGGTGEPKKKGKGGGGE